MPTSCVKSSSKFCESAKFDSFTQKTQKLFKVFTRPHYKSNSQFNPESIQSIIQRSSQKNSIVSETKKKNKMKVVWRNSCWDCTIGIELLFSHLSVFDVENTKFISLGIVQLFDSNEFWFDFLCEHALLDLLEQWDKKTRENEWMNESEWWLKEEKVIEMQQSHTFVNLVNEISLRSTWRMRYFTASFSELAA
jgi:hypothetical protein